MNNPEQKTPDYGEPWRVNDDSGQIGDIWSDETPIAMVQIQGTLRSPDNARRRELTSRIVACVNALAGIPDPAAAIQAAREAMETVIDAHRKPGVGPATALKAARAALALLTPKES